MNDATCRRRPFIQNLCFTTDCIRLSADILSSIDTSYDPCENFYEFASPSPPLAMRARD
jgi:hypothetical protein